MSRHECNIVVLGSAGVGKSDLITQYCYGFAEHGQYNPTIEDSYRKSVVIDNTSLILDIIDTAGMEEYRAMRELYIRKGRGFIIVYSVTNNSSFLDGITNILLHACEGSLDHGENNYPKVASFCLLMSREKTEFTIYFPMYDLTLPHHAVRS